ncbi:hypothetical protein [Streptomyces fuscichromogenes]|uniref:Uncharacterized protein n=1 Tax=Streptomyces fuscichromogenes TaxID=1324013 RepID=A0A917XLJ0_9ACTN|nr:hypothetical protein [Streptomyces fuscichromogenes]GGN37998.1 hypothetical protein GCM10011578_082860 [Streptomyces fuscichromogenes]
MTTIYSAVGRQSRIFVPPPAESLAPPVPQDPPIYRDLLRIWADRGRALPGRHDPEWARLAAPTVVRGQFGGFSDFQVPPHDGR